MPGTAAIQHSVLIISGAQQFTALARASLPAGRFSSIEVRTDAAAARRCLLERDFDLVLIQAPLPGENGLGLALDFADGPGGFSDSKAGDTPADSERGPVPFIHSGQNVSADERSG